MCCKGILLLTTRTDPDPLILSGRSRYESKRISRPCPLRLMSLWVKRCGSWSALRESSGVNQCQSKVIKNKQKIFHFPCTVNFVVKLIYFRLIYDSLNPHPDPHGGWNLDPHYNVRLRIHITVLVNNSLETKMHVLLVEATRRLLIEERGRGESTRQNILDDIPMTTCPFATAAFTIFNPSA